MSSYYIINQNGLLKQYFSKENLTNEDSDINQVIYTVSMRNAKVFISYEEAESMIKLKNLQNCFVVNQFGNKQEV
jgi:hypothetical protein